MKKHRDNKVPSVAAKPATSNDTASETVQPNNANDAQESSCRPRRMIFASPLPGRWIKCCGLLM
ncbi:MAG: hypothetical protein ABUL66_01000, partial [Verrucomicrobiota bacterium]